MDTIKGQLAIGLWDEKSKAFQRDFEMRLATLEDTENALEDTPEYASTARIRRHEWAACLLSVGCIPGDEITPERLAELTDLRDELQAELASLEFGILADAQERLVKKLSGGKSASPTSA